MMALAAFPLAADVMTHHATRLPQHLPFVAPLARLVTSAAATVGLGASAQVATAVGEAGEASGDPQASGIRLALMTGKQLRRLRKNAGFTQRELAALLYCSQQEVSAWEAGRYRIPTYRLEDIRDVFVQSRLDARNYQQLLTAIEHWPTVGEWGEVEK